tara:strand:- start:353 stop:2083 length:1731 start_codon:yes stop_codon:yes gene_type:complete
MNNTGAFDYQVIWSDQNLYPNNSDCYITPNFTFRPDNCTLSSTNFTGALNGNATSATTATTATTATNANNLYTTNDTTNLSRFIPFCDAYTTGNHQCLTNSNLQFNPFGGYLYTPQLVAGSNSVSTGLIKMNNLVGGYGNAAVNFHIDNLTNGSGAMLLNYGSPNCQVRVGNMGTANFAVFSNNADAVYTQTANGGLAVSQWNSKIRLHNTTSAMSVFMGDYVYTGGIYSSGIYAHHSSMTAWDVLHLNGIQTSASYWAITGKEVMCPTMWIGCDVSSGSAHQGNTALLLLGRNGTYAYGMRFGGWYGTSSGLEASFQMSYNLHIDCPTTYYLGAYANYTYINYYSNRGVFIMGTLYTSDERIKKDIIELKDDDDFIEVFDKVKAVGAYRYKYRDIYRRSSTANQYGFIAQKVRDNYNEDVISVQYGSIPNIMFDCNFSYTIDDDWVYTFTIDYDLDLDKEYLFYAFQNQEQIDTRAFQYIENVKPLTKNTFTFSPVYKEKEIKKDKEYFKLELIGTYTNDKLGINKDKLFQLGFSATLGLIKKVEKLETENEILEARIIDLETELNMIKEHLNLN